MGRGRWLSFSAFFIAMVVLTPSVYAHEQEILNVILVDDEARPGNVTDSGFVEGNGLVFRMRDSTENASMQIKIDLDKDGIFNGSDDNVSVWLTRSCTLDENGSLVDEECAVSHQFVFGNNSQGSYNYQVERMIDNITVETWNYTVEVWPDVHEEQGQPSVGDCFGSGCEEFVEEKSDSETERSKTELTLYAVMALAGLGAFIMILSIRNERLNR